MFTYKDASFYTSYFENHPDFIVKEVFNVSEDKEEKDLYVGYIEVVGTIHPLLLRVEIPKSFPHQSLTFRTKSLFGYPHLIYTGKTQHGSWFCLNTPFAETAEEQLNQEVSRLKEWINRQLRHDLPAIIDDTKVIEALRRANILDWENPDEIAEISKYALLTFVGDFANDADYFKDKKGYIHCVNTPDKRFYALRSKESTNFELPYLIVDEYPLNMDDFVALRDQYGWGEKECEHLLRDFNLYQTWTDDGSYIIGKDYTLEESLELIASVRSELEKEEPYLPAKIGSSQEVIQTKVLNQQKELILKGLDEIEKKVKKQNGFHPFQSSRPSYNKSFDEMTDEEIEYEQYLQYQEDYHMNVYPYEYHYFALGVRKENGIDWFIFYTNRKAGHFDDISFDLGIREYRMKKLISYPLGKCSTQTIDKQLFFGRGMFSSKMQGKRIALVGLGAIGSMVVESLARSGVSVVGLWDNDIVEPGNICRSTYQLSDMGESKVIALAKRIEAINPFVRIKDIKQNGWWRESDYNVNVLSFVGGSFYNNINYDDQEESISKIRDYDIIIDCTGSNEMLHFLSYAVPDADIISLCITNHANELLCVTSRNGNPFEIRKTYLSRIEQDTKNFYLEGSGCYSPTFLATNSDIASLVNLFLREFNTVMEQDRIPSSIVFSHTRRGILIDRLIDYKLDGYNICMTIPTETLFDAEEMDDNPQGEIGYVFGNYSRDGKMVMVTHIVSSEQAEDMLADAFDTSKGIIDYIGDFTYSGEDQDSYSESKLEDLAAKAADESINTNNPLLIVRNQDRTLSFFLYINNKLVQFAKQD